MDRVEARATVRERAVAAMTRFYPLVSGCGTLASSRLVNMLAGVRTADVWAPVSGGDALVPVGDLIGRAMFFTGDLDPKVSWVVDRFVRPGDVALDVGANLGLVSLRMAARVGNSGQVHAFEPNPRMVAYLEATRARNPALPLTIHPIGLGPAEATLPLTIPPANAGQASLTAQHDAVAGATRIDVPVRPLTAVAEELGLDRIDFMKIDAEGFEAGVLEGAEPLLTGPGRPRAILLEENDPVRAGALPPALSLLDRLGYALRALPRRLWRPELTRVPDDGRADAHDFVALADPD